MEYGSLINLAASQSKPQVVPEVGMGATEVMWTDRHAGTIIEVSKSGKTIKVQQDEAIRTDNNGMSDSQTYEYKRDPNGCITTVTLRKDGRWKALKTGTVFWIGKRDEYYDYSF